MLSNISEQLLKILYTKLYYMTKRIVRSQVTRGTSITKRASTSAMIFPLIVSSDIDKGVAMDFAKYAETKIGYSIKKVLEEFSNRGASDMDYRRVLGDLPIDNFMKKGENDLFNFDIFFNDKDLDNDIMGIVGETFNDILETEIILHSEAPANIITKASAASDTVIEVQMKYVTEKQEIKELVQYYSISCVPRYVDSEVLKRKIAMQDNRNFIKKYVKLNSGELKFIDVFKSEIDDLKKDAKDKATGKSDVVDALMEKMKLRDLGVNVYPCTGFLLTKDMINSLKNEDGIDLTKDSRQFMKKFLTMYLGIYDDTRNRVEQQWDYEKTMNVYSLDDIASDTSKYEKELRQLVRMNK